LEQLATLLRRRAYRRGEVVFHQGDPGDTLHMVLSGRVKVVVAAESGEEVVLFVLGPHELFGEIALLDSGPRTATVVALEPLETAILRREDFLNLLRRSPAALEGVLAALAASLRRTTDEIADFVGLDLHGRLAKKLLGLAEEYGRPVGETIEIDLSLTQEELAAMVGATRASVNKLLGIYEDRGAIARRGRHIAILRPGVLEAAARV
jgi:CRP/FNR family transcriptional regulator/CRP/FNR family cyclic AMP-dependent transcriptional regulator